MELGGGCLFSGTEIQTQTAEMTVWRDDHYSFATPITSSDSKTIIFQHLHREYSSIIEPCQLHDDYFLDLLYSSTLIAQIVSLISSWQVQLLKVNDYII